MSESCESAGVFDSPRIDPLVARIVTAAKRDRTDATLIREPELALIIKQANDIAQADNRFYDITRLMIAEAMFANTRLAESRAEVARKDAALTEILTKGNAWAIRIARAALTKEADSDES